MVFLCSNKYQISSLFFLVSVVLLSLPFLLFCISFFSHVAAEIAFFLKFSLQNCIISSSNAIGTLFQRTMKQ